LCVPGFLLTYGHVLQENITSIPFLSLADFIEISLPGISGICTSPFGNSPPIGSDSLPIVNADKTDNRADEIIAILTTFSYESFQEN